MSLTDPQEVAVVKSVPTGAWLGGKSVDLDRTFAVDDPATGEALTEVADAGPSEAARALDLAVEHQADWAATTPRERGEVLRGAFELLVDRADDLALLMTLEMGKPLAEARGEVAYARRVLPLVRRGGGAHRRRLHCATRPGPVASSRAASRSARASSSRPGTSRWRWARASSAPRWPRAARRSSSRRSSDATHDARPGAASWRRRVSPTACVVVTTKRCRRGGLEPLLADRRTRKLSFTGSTEVGRVLLRQAADNVLRTSMELGGNAALIVCDDADLDVARRRCHGGQDAQHR